MAGSFVAANTGGGSTSVVLTKPTGTIDGDYMVTVFCSRSATITTLSGWTLLGSQTATQERVFVFGRVASSEGASYTWVSSSGNNSAFVASYRDCELDLIGSFATSNATDIVCPSVTATATGILLCIAGADIAGSYTPPSGMTERVDYTSGSSADGTIGLFDLAAQSAGATGTKTAVASSSAKQAGVLLMLKDIITYKPDSLFFGNNF